MKGILSLKRLKQLRRGFNRKLRAYCSEKKVSLPKFRDWKRVRSFKKRYVRFVSVLMMQFNVNAKSLYWEISNIS